MTARLIDNITVELDDEGYLKNPEDWTPTIAETFAKEEGINLSEKHWKVINFVRDYYKEHGEPPTLRRITKLSGISTKEIYRLFPNGPAKKVARIAGLGKPKGCI